MLEMLFVFVIIGAGVYGFYAVYQHKQSQSGLETRLNARLIELESELDEMSHLPDQVENQANVLIKITKEIAENSKATRDLKTSQSTVEAQVIGFNQATANLSRAISGKSQRLELSPRAIRSLAKVMNQPTRTIGYERMIKHSKYGQVKKIQSKTEAAPKTKKKKYKKLVLPKEQRAQALKAF